MPYQNINDNIYEVGTIIHAKEDPAIKLQINNYYQRIYYCTVVENPSAKQKVYFERELIKPGDQTHVSL